MKPEGIEEGKVKFDIARPDGRLERTCACGVGHPVGHRDLEQAKLLWTYIHGCCSKYCCNKWWNDGTIRL